LISLPGENLGKQWSAPAWSPRTCKVGDLRADLEEGFPHLLQPRGHGL
jgi:hypothetical protein